MKYVKVFILLMMLAALLLAGCSPSAATPVPADRPAAPPAVDAPSTPAEAAAVPTKTDSPWQVVRETEVKPVMRMAAFLNENFGLHGGPNTGAFEHMDVPSDGKAQYTTDGGKTWTIADTSNGCTFGLDIVDAQTIWQCSRNAINVSGDGGKTWQNAGQGLADCPLIFADTKTGWVLKKGNIEMTTDRGKTWQKVTLPENAGDIATISPRTASEGYVLTSDGLLHKTQDGGKNWSSVALDMTKYGKMKFLPSPTPGYPPTVAIRFFDANHEVIVMSLAGGGSKVVALRTADGGQTWAEEEVPAPIGTLHLTHDGKYLTVIPMLETQKITVLKYTGG